MRSPALRTVPPNALCRKYGFAHIGEFEVKFGTGRCMWNHWPST